MTTCTLTAGSTVITLPYDIAWLDEFGPSLVGQTVEVGSTGSLIIETAKQLFGRPITLSSGGSGDYYAIPDRATVNALYALAETVSDVPMTLAMVDGRSFSVGFRWHDTPAFSATPFQPIAPVADADLYTIILKLMVVA